MRQLVRVAVAAALLAVLGRPVPAAAETAEQCLASMNQYRTAAGLTKASSTSIPALGKAAAAHAAYRVKTDTATVDYLALLGLPDLGLFGPDQTAHLESPRKELGFTGKNPWDRTKAAKLADGTWRYQYEDVTTATGISAANLKGVRSWIDAPYHRLPLLDANTRHIGCAVDQQGSYTAQVLEMAATWKDTTKRITLYPAPGQKAVPVSFNRCQEHPTPFGGACASTTPTQQVGYVVTVHADGYYAMKVQGITFSKGSARAPVDIHRAVRYRTITSTVPSSAVDTNLPANAAMLAAKAPWPPPPPTTSASPGTCRRPRAASGCRSRPGSGRSPPPDPRRRTRSVAPAAAFALGLNSYSIGPNACLKLPDPVKIRVLLDN